MVAGKLFAVLEAGERSFYMFVHEYGYLSLGLLALACWTLFWTLRCTYRLYLHPLAKFPGPRAAAISTAWVAEKTKTGHAEEIFKKLHEQYNTHALRIGPNELHITDVSKYRTIYSQTHPYPKLKDFYDAFGIPHTVFVETDASLHKIRRKLLNPFFSKAGLLKIEGAMKARVQILREKLTVLTKQNKVINAYSAFRCVTADVISEYAFAKCLDLTRKSDDAFYCDFLDTFDAVAVIIWEVAFSPVARKLGMAIPKSIAAALSKELKTLFRFGDVAAQSLQAWKTTEKKPTHPVIFDALTSCTDEEATAEAVDILAAGSDTTAFSLSVGMWHIAHEPAIQTKLVAALKEVIPDATELPSTATLENIPYLQACVKESIRVAHAVPGRLPRIVPASSTPLVVDNKTVPPGSVVGMSAYTMHNDTDFWGPNARAFNPDRWLALNAKSLDAQFASFSKGARSCIGQNLAYMEASMVLAMVYRCFEAELTEESRKVLRTEDNFTLSIKEPGVMLRLRPVAA